MAISGEDLILLRSLRILFRLDFVGQVGRLHKRGEAKEASPKHFRPFAVSNRSGIA
jgi:hypothetical protein